jgi:hypothetical protein
MNMSSVEDDSYESYSYESESDYGGYSDADLSDEELGDRYAEDAKQTEIYKIEDEVEQAEEERKYKASLLQHPDEMEFIRPARKLPSVEEMNAWFYSLLNAEAEARVRAWAVPIIEAWWKRCLITKAEKAEEKRMEWRCQELAEWKKVRAPRRWISQLGPLVIFEDEYALMREYRNNHRLIKAGIEAHVQSAKAKADAIVAAERAAIRDRKAGKARAQAKKGMNKNTTWHQARESGSLAIKTKSPAPISDEGKGKRVQRKIRREKERQEAAEHAARLQEEKKATFVFVDLKDERTDEEKAAEEAELEEALRRMNRACVEKISQQEAQEAQAQTEAKAAAELKANEEAELAEFVTVMSKNHKPKTKKVVIDLGFKSLKEQKIEQRRATDEKFNARCEGFDDLSSKEKLAEVLKFTSLCRSVASKKKCYHKDCRFAHSIDQLQQKDCRFGLGCKFVKKMENGQYKNAKFGCTGKTCSCMHPGEHKRGFCIRMGLKYVPDESEKIQEVKPATVFISAPIKAPGVPSVWTKVVSAAETAEKVAECKAKMTKAWSAVVVETLTEEKKAEIYGKGVELLGAVSDERDSVPIIPSTIRKPWDKHGLGFFDQEQKTSTKLLVTTHGFSWVKGAVLEPEQKKRWDPVLDPVMVKVAAAVQAINERVAKIQTADIERRVRKAKAKAAEITKRLAAIEKKTWTKVEGRKSVRGVTKEPEVTVLRVPRADAELALLGAIRNGLTNFRIEYTDSPPKPERSGEEEEEYQDERCDCGDNRPHVIGWWGYEKAMIPSRFNTGQ